MYIACIKLHVYSPYDSKKPCRMDIPVLSIISDLEEDGYISVERIGRRNRYKVNPKKKFRHPGEADHSIGELLNIFSE